MTTSKQEDSFPSADGMPWSRIPEELAQDYEDFLTSGTSTPQEGAKPIGGASAAALPMKRRIERDLVRSPSQIAVRYGVLSLIGYFVSLLVCAQNSLGLSRFSHNFAASLHALPEIVCPMACGAIFTGVPFVLAALLLTRFQHRYLLLRMWWFVAAVPLLATFSMLFLPHHMQHSQFARHGGHAGNLSDASWLAIWTVSSILVPYVFEAAVYFLVRPKRYRKDQSKVQAETV